MDAAAASAAAANASSTSAPWLSGVLGQVSHDTSSSDAYQYAIPGVPGTAPSPTGSPNGYMAPGGGFPNSQPTGGGFPATPNGGAAAGRPGANGAAAGGLKPFLPAGIENIIGLIGLNSVLVRAKSEDDIDQLSQLIKMLDQPVKQVLVEVMFVDMTVEDAMDLSASFSYSGMPLSVVATNGGNSGNLAVQYMKGDIQTSISALMSKSWQKVVNAPRVIVQNGSSASVYFTQSIPEITLDEEEDVFGRTIEEPTINFQSFTQGLSVNQVTIHPDDSVTLDVTPQLQSPSTVGVPIPGGGSGNVYGSNTSTIATVVRVKNGETIMMGGFITKNDLQQATQTPLLGMIPLIGPLLFGSHANSTDDEETMIFLTPTIMKEDTTDFGGMTTLPPLF